MAEVSIFCMARKPNCYDNVKGSMFREEPIREHKLSELDKKGAI